MSFEQQLFETAIQLGKEQIIKVADYVQWSRSRAGITDDDPTPDYYLEPRIKEGLGLIAGTERKLLALAVRYFHGDSVRDLVEPFAFDEQLAMGAVANEFRHRHTSGCESG
jgi:hypothetical protein